MRSNRFYLIATLTLIAILGYLLFKTISPFFMSIAWAVIFTIVFFPLYLIILRYVKKDYMASLITTFIIILFIAGPVTYFGVILVKEIKEISSFITHERIEELKDGPSYLRKVLGYLPFSEIETENLTKLVKDIIISTIYGGVVVALIQATIGGRTKMPAIVIFFSVLGGIKEFGLIGLVAGPLIVALFVSLIEILRKIE